MKIRIAMVGIFNNNNNDNIYNNDKPSRRSAAG